MGEHSNAVPLPSTRDERPVDAAYNRSLRRGGVASHSNGMVVAALVRTGRQGFLLHAAGKRGVQLDKLSYVSAFAPLMALLLALDYRSELDRLTPLRVLALVAIPSITLVLVFTNEWHHLIWTEYHDSIPARQIRPLVLDI